MKEFLKDFWDDIGEGLCYIFLNVIGSVLMLWAFIRLIKYFWFL